MTIKLIVGLGNIGDNYIDTRHNLGSKYVKLLAEKYQVVLSKNYKLVGYIGLLKLKNNIMVQLLIPNSYMNSSGISVLKCVVLYKVNPKEILIAHDELDLPPGVIKIKLGKKSGDTHRGLKDIITCLNNSNFYRLRIGIGKPNYKSEIIKFVLNKPLFDELTMIDNVINKVVMSTESIIHEKFVKSYNCF